MKTTLIVLGLLFSLVFLVVGVYIFLMTKISFDDLIQMEGTLAKPPKIQYDEDGGEVGMRFIIEDNTRPLSLGGILLRKSDPKVYDLKEGDEISYHMRKSEQNSIFTSTPIIIFSLKHAKENYVEVEEGLNHFQGPKMYVIATMFLIMALIISYYTIRSWIK